MKIYIGVNILKFWKEKVVGLLLLKILECARFVHSRTNGYKLVFKIGSCLLLMVF